VCLLNLSKNGDVKLTNETHEATETILVVEDDEIVRDTIEYMLRNSGYNVILAGSGEQVFKRINTITLKGIDLVIADVVLPTMSGRDVVFILERIMPAIKVLYISGYPDSVISQFKILEEGLNYLPKPFKRVTLLKKMREVLDS
jgi:DNA-binding response OmpR family regulator